MVPGAALLLCLFAPPQQDLAALAAEIDRTASREVPILAADTRVRAAERLRITAPALAQKLLDSALAARPHGNSVYNVLSAYAKLDPAAAERAAEGISDRDWALNALITQAVTVKDFGRAARLIRTALAGGHHRLGAIAFALGVMPDRGKLLREVVEAFPESGTVHDIRPLFSALAAVPEVEPTLAREAIRKAFRILDRPGAAVTQDDVEQTATFRLHPGIEIQTETTYETALVQASLYLAAYDFAGWYYRRPSLPRWRNWIPHLNPAQVASIAGRVRTLGKLKPGPKPDQLPDFRTMPFEEARAGMLAIAPRLRAGYLSTLLQRDDASDAQRRAVLADLAEAIPHQTVVQRQWTARSVFSAVLKSGTDDLVEASGRASIDFIDQYARTGDKRLGGHESRIRADLVWITDELAKRGRPLQHASAESQRLLHALDLRQLQAVDFSLPGVDSRTYRLSDFRGKVVLLDFWATWCGPCREAIPILEKLHQEQNIVVLGVSDEPARTVRAFAGPTYLMLLDENRQIHDLFGVDGIPATFVIDRKGTVVDRVPFPHTEENLRRALAAVAQ